MHLAALVLALTLFPNMADAMTGAATPVTGLWSGSFAAGDLRGGLQLRLPSSPGDASSLILQPSGRTAIYRIENLSVTAEGVSLEAPAGGKRRLRFEGRLTGNRLAGTVRLLSENGDADGTWSAVRLLPVAPRGALPAVHGPFAVGRTSFDWTDAARDERHAPGEKRELVVHVWYPAARSSRCVPAPYLPDAKLMGEALPAEVAASVTSAATGACLDAALSRVRKRYPVVIFSPGDEFKTLGYSALEEDLASRGYIVAAIDYPYNAPVVELSRGRIARPPSEEPPANLTPDQMKKYAYDQTLTQLDEWGLDIVFVASRMRALDRNDPRFRGHVDASHIGAIGHSAGGMASFHACQLDPRLAACADLDGRYRMRPYPIATAVEAPKQPFLWIHTPNTILTDEQLAQRGLTRGDFDAEVALGKSIMTAAPGSYDVTVDQIGADHLDFTDFRIFEKDIRDDALAARQRTLELTRLAVAAFFDEAFHRKGPSMREALPAGRYPDVTVAR